jgi:hypothetical protein
MNAGTPKDTDQVWACHKKSRLNAGKGKPGIVFQMPGGS